MIVVNSQMVKQLNQMAIIRNIQINESTSRQEIARVTGLSNSTVSILVSELIDSGIVKELGEGESSGGRKSKLIGINEEGGYILGVDVGSSKTICGIVDLRANIRKKMIIDTPKDPNERLTALINLLRDMREVGRANNMDNFLGIGIGVSGVVDSQNGIISSSNMGWQKVNLRKEIEYAVGLSTSVENTAKAGALAEYYYGQAIDVEHLLYISVGKGIGAGFLINGSLLTGMRNAAGEIGHMRMVPDGLPCSCGRYGCLETIASGHAIESSALKEISKSAQLRKIYDQYGTISAEHVFQSALDGDEVAQNIINTAIEFTAMATENLVNMFNPEMVVFGGGLSNAGSYYLDPIMNKMKESLAKERNKELQLKFSSLGRDSGVLGAATLVIKQIFRPIESRF